jgi:hypothetical protein
MKSKSFLILEASLILLGMLAFQACASDPHYYGPGYYGPPSGTVVLGDYDENHVWHDRYWWISNHHDWVHQHHPDWVANETPAEHKAYEEHNP